MRDSLKEHIENSREDFELYPFNSEKGWEGIEDKVIPNHSKRDSWRVMGIIACFVFIISGGIFFMNPLNSENSEMAEVERYYNGEINQKIILIKGQLKDDYILQDLEKMDAAFAELKADLKDNVDNQEVVTAMMENYRLKLQILDEILTALEKENVEEVL